MIAFPMCLQNYVLVLVVYKIKRNVKAAVNWSKQSVWMQWLLQPTLNQQNGREDWFQTEEAKHCLALKQE